MSIASTKTFIDAIYKIDADYSKLLRDIGRMIKSAPLTELTNKSKDVLDAAVDKKRLSKICKNMSFNELIDLFKKCCDLSNYLGCITHSIDASLIHEPKEDADDIYDTVNFMANDSFEISSNIFETAGELEQLIVSRFIKENNLDKYVIHKNTKTLGVFTLWLNDNDNMLQINFQPIKDDSTNNIASKKCDIKWNSCELAETLERILNDFEPYNDI